MRSIEHVSAHALTRQLIPPTGHQIWSLWLQAFQKILRGFKIGI